MAEYETSQCEHIGEAMPDIAGIGILLSFGVQGLLSLVLTLWFFFLSKLGGLTLRHHEGSQEHEEEVARLKIIMRVIMSGYDAQMATGMALIVTALANQKTIDLYHLRLVYEVASFVGVSGAATMTTWAYIRGRIKPFRSVTLGKQQTKFSRRHIALYSYTSLFLALTILLGVRLNEWSADAEPGRCYNTQLLSLSSASHPRSDLIYVGTTATYLFVTLGFAVFETKRQMKTLIIAALVQYPLHLYFMLALRKTNTHGLAGPEREDGWDFGQTVALTLLALTFSDILRGFIEHRQYEAKLKAAYQPVDADMEARKTGVEMQ